MTFTQCAYPIFEQSIVDYHVHDDVDHPIQNPYQEGSIEAYLYVKNWIDTVQWHLEDLIRDPQIDPVAALALKRRIDKSNQDRTDLVEMIDSYFLDHLQGCGGEGGCHHQYGESCLGGGQVVYLGTENLPHEGAGKPC